MAKQVLPTFLKGVISYDDYNKWLEGKAKSHVIRDRKRGFADTSVSSYISDIHDAVLESGGCDSYTGEKLDWSLLAVTYDPKDRRRFAMRPTVDHIDASTGRADFAICGQRTNMCKSYLTVDELAQFCMTFLRAQDKLPAGVFD